MYQDECCINIFWLWLIKFNKFVKFWIFDQSLIILVCILNVSCPVCSLYCIRYNFGFIVMCRWAQFDRVSIFCVWTEHVFGVEVRIGIYFILKLFFLVLLQHCLTVCCFGYHSPDPSFLFDPVPVVKILEIYKETGTTFSLHDSCDML